MTNSHFFYSNSNNHFEISTNINCQSKSITKTVRQPRSSPSSCTLPSPILLYPSIARPQYPLPSLLLRHQQSFIITFLTIPSKTSSTPRFLDHRSQEIISLQIHIFQQPACRVEPLECVETPSQLLLLGPQLEHLSEKAPQ